ncbi:MaoC/PaaZ C-terminal domain-containing protein [Nocardioides sp.]|uniref:MaoC/PaaZ C-terminal domain-containing protein n=1 Tax=Nocardioides sp. TaxID=35761 RepID=UPI002B278C1F|nr:MaoC/PaaZ C-terminal domain-containing protein [Nocardioides sp.]
MAFEPKTYSVTRADLTAYAIASGDHNPIHQDEDVARSVGLPGVIAHGMFTLALVGRYLAECGVPQSDVVELGGKFVKPVVVPAGGAEVTMSATTRDAAEGEGSVVSIEVLCDGAKVFGPRGAQARLRG